MFIRDITLEDADLYYEMSLDFFAGDATLFPMTKDKLSRTLAQALNSSPYLRLLIFEHEGEIAGYALLAFYWSNEVGGMVTLLEELYVRPMMRGKKIGHHFLDWLFTTYDQTTKRYRLEVCACNTGARKLYENYGFNTLDYIQMIKDQK